MSAIDNRAIVIGYSMLLWMACSSDSSLDRSDTGVDAGVVGDAGDYVPLREAGEFVAVSMEIAGGTCLDCWRVLGVEEPRVLVLEDGLGEERFELSETEYQNVLDVVLSPEFQQEMNKSVTWECGQLQDLETVVTVEWKGAADGGMEGRGVVQHAKLSDGCFGRCDQSDHPYMVLRTLLFEAKSRYMTSCETDAQSEKWPLICSLAEHHPLPPPMDRMLCAVCVEDCGVNEP